MNATNPKTDFFFDKPSPWQKEYNLLRDIVLGCGLTEELKWGCPCYTHDGKNVVLIHGFKEYCALLFHKGALLRDPAGILIQQTENVQSARQVRFTTASQITKLKATLKAYIKDATEVERSGRTIVKKTTAEYPVPEEFQKRLKGDTNLKAAFNALTPGRQRGYLFYFSQAKQAKTREARVEKCIPAILDGRGLED
jgi:uncharacterized protein YdeI (YjbR/CyaY-like superfamily)